MKVLVVTPVFSIAGVPLAQLRFATALSRRANSVDLMIGYVHPEFSVPDSDGPRVIHLNKRRVRDMLLPLVQYLRREKPDVVFSAEDHLNAIVLIALVLSGSKAKVSCSSRVTPFDTYSDALLSKRWWLRYIMQAVMGRADVLTCVSKDMVSQYREVFSDPPHVCVYNVVVDGAAPERMNESVEHEWFQLQRAPLIVAAGKLAPWKGFGDLIEAMPAVVSRTGAKLAILGEGPLRGELMDRISALDLEQSVQLLGYVSNPLKYFRRADVFALSSHVEGLPNVLVEAMMCGCTPVATDCPTGPREVLDGGRCGYLVPVRDVQAMSEALCTALENPVDKMFLEEAILPFSEQAVLDRHFDLLGIAS